MLERDKTRRNFLKTIVLSASVIVLPDVLSAGKKAQRQKNPAYEPIEDDPNLPRVLLIGDSISIGYTVMTRDILAGKANVHRPLMNCGPTSRGLEHLESWLGEKKWDVIHFNWGLHDLKYIDEEEKLAEVDKGKQQITIEQYEKNLKELVKRLKKTGAKLIWASTTPVPEGAKGRVKGDEIKYNAAAEKIMKKHGVMIDDLYSLAMPRLKDIQKPQDVHFHEHGSQVLAEQVAASILKALGKSD